MRHKPIHLHQYSSKELSWLWDSERKKRKNLSNFDTKHMFCNTGIKILADFNLHFSNTERENSSKEKPKQVKWLTYKQLTRICAWFPLFLYKQRMWETSTWKMNNFWIYENWLYARNVNYLGSIFPCSSSNHCSRSLVSKNLKMNKCAPLEYDNCIG